MKKNIILLFCFFQSIFITIKAQQSTLAAGANFVSSSGSVSFSIGQVAYTSQTTSNSFVNQGVQQPFEFFATSVNKIEKKIDIKAYPNPTTELLNLEFKGDFFQNLRIQLYDVQGKLIQTEDMKSKVIVLNLRELSSAFYFLNILDEQNNLIDTFKIVKTN